MIALISQRQEKNKHNSLIDSLEKSYVEFFSKLGIFLIPVPNSEKNINFYFENLQVNLVILSGGNDINPKLYGSMGTSESVSIERDNTEKKLLDIAISKNIPVFGVCRGMQFINVYFKGKLKKIEEHVGKEHGIKIINEKFKQAIGAEAIVNSYHNFGLTKEELSDKLIAFANSDDGVIEGIFHPSLSIIGIQWHPERGKEDKINNLLINSLIK